MLEPPSLLDAVSIVKMLAPGRIMSEASREALRE